MEDEEVFKYFWFKIKWFKKLKDLEEIGNYFVLKMNTSIQKYFNLF